MTLIQQLEARSKALNAREVAELLGISKQHVYEMAANGSLPAFYVGRSIRFDPQELADCLRKKKPKSTRDPQGRNVGADPSVKTESGSLHRIWRERFTHSETAAALARDVEER